MIVCIGDVHFPYEDEKSLDKVYALIQKLKPTTVVQMGDAYDLYSFSMHARSCMALSPAEELSKGRDKLEAFWTTIKSIVPKADKHSLTGNHDARLWRTLMTRAPEYEAVLEQLDAKQLFRVKGVTLHEDWQEPVLIQGLMFHHGWTLFGRHFKHFLQSTVVGHTHRGGVEFLRLHDRTIFELSCGFLGDRKALAFKYTATTMNNWHSGLGVIDEYGPRFISL